MLAPSPSAMFRSLVPLLRQTLQHRAQHTITTLKTPQCRYFSTQPVQTWAALPRNQFPQDAQWTAWNCPQPASTTSIQPLITIFTTPNPLSTISKTTMTSITPATPTIPKKRFRRLRRILPLLAISAAAYGYFTLTPIFSSEGFKRSAYFWSNAGPIYLHYQWIVYKLDIRQFITDMLYDYDHGGNGFGHRGFSHHNLKAAEDELNAAKTELKKQLQLISGTSETSKPQYESNLTEVVLKQQQTAAEMQMNINKADRLFFHITQLADKLRDVASETSQKADNDTFHQLKVLIKRSCREITSTFQTVVNDLLSLEQHAAIDELAHKVQLQLSELTRALVGMVEDQLRPYALPLDKIEKKAHRDETFEPLNKKYADDIYNIIYALKAYYFKIAQLGAIRPDVLPPEWITSLKRFQSDCPHVPLVDLLPMIERELGKSVTDVFSHIDHIPLGAASIGQAHLATLKDGRQVVIKIQYPNVEETFRGDMKTIRDFCELAQPEFLPSLDEVEKQFLTEFDFRREAVNLFFAHYDLKHSMFNEEVAIPAPVGELCTKSVLTMEFLPGKKLGDKLQDDVSALAQESGMTIEEFMTKHANQPPPLSEEIAQFRFYGKLYDAAVNTSRCVYNWTAGWFTDPYDYQQTTVPLDIRYIMENLFKVHSFQFFFGSLLNCDNHPGNLMYCEGGKFSDNNQGGTIGLIDYGQVKATNLYYRALIAKTLIFLEEQKDEEIDMLYFFSDQRTKHNYRDYPREYTILGFDYDDEISRHGMNIQAFFEHLNDLEPVIYQQPQFEMVGRSCFLLRGLSHAVQYPIKTHQIWTQDARKFLEEHPVLDQIITAALEEFTEHYIKAEEKAKAIAMEEHGTTKEFFVNLDNAEYIHKWAEAMCTEYNNLVYHQLYPAFPLSIGDPQKLTKKLDNYRKNRPAVYQKVKQWLPSQFCRPSSGLLPQEFAQKKPRFVQQFELAALAGNLYHDV